MIKLRYTPSNIFDYIYALLHSPTYRQKYKEYLKVDFPRIPYPKDASTFWILVNLGSELRRVHLLDSSKCEEYITSYPNSGDNSVGKPEFTIEATSNTGKTWINETQYFDGVPEIAWRFHMGGYQPAQKWLKDRVGRTLTSDDIFHYQKIIVALSETDRIMREIDKVPFE